MNKEQLSRVVKIACEIEEVFAKYEAGSVEAVAVVAMVLGKALDEGGERFPLPPELYAAVRTFVDTVWVPPREH